MHESRTRATSRGTAVRGAAAVALLLLLAVPASAFAHAAIETATPADEAVLAEPPTEIVITYTEGLADGSSIVLKDATGGTIATGTPAAVGALEMRVTFAPLAPGAYTIESTTRSVEDGDVDRQTLTFTVAEPTPPPATATPGPTEAPSDAATAAPTAADSPTPAPTPAPGADGGGDDTAVLLPIVVVGLLIGGGLAFFLRRRSAT
jgi:methionine-rich copper-binding protein CopC